MNTEEQRRPGALQSGQQQLERLVGHAVIGLSRPEHRRLTVEPERPSSHGPFRHAVDVVKRVIARVAGHMDAFRRYAPARMERGHHRVLHEETIQALLIASTEAPGKVLHDEHGDSTCGGSGGHERLHIGIPGFNLDILGTPPDHRAGRHGLDETGRAAVLGFEPDRVDIQAMTFPP